MVEELLQRHSPKFQGMKEIYRVIHQEQLITKAELLERTNMKQTTVVRHLEALKQYGLIRIASHDESSGGRPPALYAIEPEAAFIIGISLSRVETTITVVNMSFQLVTSETFQMTEKHTPSHTMSLLKNTIASLLEDHHIDINDILGIGIGTVGPLDRKKGIMYPEGFVAPGWNKVSIVEEMKKAFHTDIFLENGANTAALYESLRYDGGNKTILYCISGWGLRCGVLANGAIMQSRKGDASSFGEMIIDAPSNRTLASYISYHQIAAEVERMIKARELQTDFYPDLNDNKNEIMAYVLDELKTGNVVIENMVLASAYYYGIGLANMVNVLHPEIVVLNSELINIYPAYYKKVIHTAEAFIFQKHQHELSFQLAGNTEHPISIGACVLTFHSKFS
ncbi:ROK family transcriptional regulator [Salibacterium salarium]|uniref:ROK family transcriptional regulator n=1 Tax=Salibacterium salarium TaxID=284579 RepID=A0A428MRX7_9BACI|nr:ROK family transcriptional regulator [Salibacterium salarium]RSL28901.1 ROK family transcriptional regulator [Salibacterium salarium]